MHESTSSWPTADAFFKDKASVRLAQIKSFFAHMTKEGAAFPGEVFVYLIENRDTGKSYVGLTIDLRARLRDHLVACDHGVGRYFQAALKTYGADNFDVSVLAVCATREEGEEQERYWIRRKQTMNSEFGYNLTEGGDGVSGLVVSEKTRQRLSEQKRKDWQDPEYRARQIAAANAANPQRSETLRNVWKTPEMRAKHAAGWERLRERRQADLLDFMCH